MGDVSVVDLSGRITLADEFDLFRDTIRALVNDGHRNVLLNLKDVEYVDSAGLGAIVSCYATLANLGGSLKLLSPQTRVGSMLQVTRLYTLLVVYNDEAEAIRSFRSSSELGAGG